MVSSVVELCGDVFYFWMVWSNSVASETKWSQSFFKEGDGWGCGGVFEQVLCGVEAGLQSFQAGTWSSSDDSNMDRP